MGNPPGKREKAGTAGAPVPTTLVLGLGNPLRGDDGVGVRVVQQLAKWCLPSDVEVVDGGTRGLGLVSLLVPGMPGFWIMARVARPDARQRSFPSERIEAERRGQSTGTT